MSTCSLHTGQNYSLLVLWALAHRPEQLDLSMLSQFNFSSLSPCLALLATAPAGQWIDDVFEICGGEHRITKVCVRRHLATGQK